MPGAFHTRLFALDSNGAGTVNLPTSRLYAVDAGTAGGTIYSPTGFGDASRQIYDDAHAPLLVQYLSISNGVPGYVARVVIGY